MRRHPDDVAVLRLLGEHDLATAGAVTRAVRAIVEEPSLLVIDLSRVEYVDSTVLDTVAAADRLLRRRGARVALVTGGVPVVSLALRMCGLLDEVPHCEDEAGAVELARASAGT